MMSQSASKTKMPLEGVKTIHVYDREQIASLFEGAFLASSKADPSLNDQDDMSGFVENNSTYGHSDSLSHTGMRISCWFETSFMICYGKCQYLLLSCPLIILVCHFLWVYTFMMS